MDQSQEILSLIAKRDEAGLIGLVEAYAPLLKSVINKHLYNLRHYQGECLNDTLLAIWNHYDSYQADKGSFKSWICAIARYRAINYLKKYRNELSEESLEGSQLVFATVEDQPFNRELWELELEDLLAPLSPQDQAIFRSVFIDEDSIEQVSERQNLKPNTVYARISRGRKKLFERGR